MKLLMLSGDRSLLSGKRGAFWYTLEELSKHFDRIDIITPRVKASAAKRHDIPLFKNIFVHPSPWNLLSQPRWIVRKGCELINAHRHDVMTVHDFPPFYNGRGAKRLHRRTGIPFALEVHHIVGYPVGANWAETIGRISSRFCLPRDAKAASAVRVVNAEVKKILTMWGVPAKNIHVVPSFYLDAKLLKPDPKIKKEYDLVFCGRLAPNKGLIELIETMHFIPNVRLLVIGDGPLKASAVRKAHEYAAGRVHFAGWLATNEEVIRAMQSAKVLVMYSKSEGGPRVALEAMACGMPVIATKVGVMPEVIEDNVNGVLVGTDPHELIAAIKILLADEKLRTKLGRNAAKIVEKFERGKLIRGYAEFLKGVKKR